MYVAWREWSARHRLIEWLIMHRNIRLQNLNIIWQLDKINRPADLPTVLLLLLLLLYVQYVWIRSFSYWDTIASSVRSAVNHINIVYIQFLILYFRPYYYYYNYYCYVPSTVYTMVWNRTPIRPSRRCDRRNLPTDPSAPPAPASPPGSLRPGRSSSVY